MEGWVLAAMLFGVMIGFCLAAANQVIVKGKPEQGLYAEYKGIVYELVRVERQDKGE